MKLLKEYKKRVILKEPINVFQQMRDIRDHDRELFAVFHLDTKNKVICREIAHIGTLNSCLIHPREVFKKAIINSANAIIVSHNHPSGDPTPSEEDKEVTENLRNAGETLNIRLIDHVIVGKAEYFSMADLEKGR